MKKKKWNIVDKCEQFSSFVTLSKHPKRTRGTPPRHA